jgi:crotonobetainyl-CoA:carnitine CoA-transferase CaiB-like acyl-CoA transferase
VQSLGLRVELPHGKRGKVAVVGNPVRLSETPARMQSSAPDLGADNATILGKIA